MIPMMTFSQGEGGSEREILAARCALLTITLLLPLLNRFDFRSTRSKTPLRSGGQANGH
ncbi:YmjE family protein [Citrobacter rodentium]|uniref:YmjE family protein n=2 Tax=Citrobacter rodentium TaxID=67825 RepID=UPI003B8A95A2